jgi:hypothetical protein
VTPARTADLLAHYCSIGFMEHLALSPHRCRADPPLSGRPYFRRTVSLRRQAVEPGAVEQTDPAWHDED